jgi:large subunit ribosomal protein L21
MNYAIVRLGGKQFKIEEGDTVTVERQQSPVNVEVLAYAEGDTITLGTPVLTNVTVTAEVIDEKTVKTVVSRYKSKSRYRKSNGHKQPFSIIKISKISVGEVK